MKPKTMKSFTIALALGITFAGPIAANTHETQGFDIAATMASTVISPKSTFILNAEVVMTRKPAIRMIVLTTMAMPTLWNA